MLHGTAQGRPRMRDYERDIGIVVFDRRHLPTWVIGVVDIFSDCHDRRILYNFQSISLNLLTANDLLAYISFVSIVSLRTDSQTRASLR